MANVEDMDDLSTCILPFGLPPVFSSMRSKLEGYLACPEKLPMYNLERVQKRWPRKPCPEKLFSTGPHAASTELKMDRNPKTGELIGFHEVVKDATSLHPLSSTESFILGGTDEPTGDEIQKLERGEEEIDFEKDLLTVPPGFDSGINFEVKKDDVATERPAEGGGNNFDGILNAGGDGIGVSEAFDVTPASQSRLADASVKVSGINEELRKDVDEIINKEIPVLKISEPVQAKKLRKVEWAEELDTSQRIKDFDARIPTMAMTWDFKLDPFQQQAILRLENKENVFVAAHTSAGKTVVAEYAIALALRHNMKAIYTSPIKALSNQKYRDFRRKFRNENVGLLTGDYQINNKASCLIMTTEILRSMLYKVDDTVRELEWVIFDEVHYINDQERGVVWEEVVIMLPEHVNIVMLSATAPNFMEFADWVGRTRKKMMFVVATTKRPVALEHYLYTGHDGNTMDNVFKIMDEDKRFLTEGYRRAAKAVEARYVAAVPDDAKDGKFKKGPQQQKPANKKQAQKPVAQFERNFMSEKQENRMWKTLIGYLLKNDKLPAVVFVFSRDRCDKYANRLKSQDLVPDRKEKLSIRRFFKKCIHSLKPCDQQLPQVKCMGELIENGIGVHHSGILPILKEIVEMLFEDKKIKVLFATETFAMGVNMPARTVIFDSVRKHDGKELRNLLSNEYIQMAGRAGRRKIDKTGTVLIMCKIKVPDESALKVIMQEGNATPLESKFRLTYGMMLNLMRSNQKISVLNIMKRSFTEDKQQVQREKSLDLIRSATEELEAMSKLECLVCVPEDVNRGIGKLVETVAEMLELKHSLQQNVSALAIAPGRVVVVNHGHRNRPAVVLKRHTNRVTLFVLTGPADNIMEGVEERDKVATLLLHGTYWIDRKLYVPEAPAGHVVVECKEDAVLDVASASIRIDPERIIKNWEQRQIPRFRLDPPNESCVIATEDLFRWATENREGCTMLDYKHHFKGNADNFDLPIRFDRHQRDLAQYECVSCPSFEEHLLHELKRYNLEVKIQRLKHQLSEEQLLQYPDYKARLKVLEDMKYIAADHRVQLRGRVACTMSNHELVVTELILKGMLKNLRKEEIAAVLSCLVFSQKVTKQQSKSDRLDELKHNAVMKQKGPVRQDKRDVKQALALQQSQLRGHFEEPKRLPDSLEEAIDETKKIIREIDELQQECGVHDDGFVEQFSFGIAEVVYHWAKNKDFAHIAKLTDIQEGIIVRTIVRLVEVLKNVREAVNQVGIVELAQKLEEASNGIKRDIVFAPSLYTIDVAISNDPDVRTDGGGER